MNKNYFKVFYFFMSVSFIFLLSACGQKGPLYIQNDNEMPQVEYVHEQEAIKNSTNDDSEK